MRRFNQTEAKVIQMRHLTINGEKPGTKVWKLQWCGQTVFQSQYYGFCVSEKNRLIANHNYKENNFKII